MKNFWLLLFVISLAPYASAELPKYQEVTANIPAVDNGELHRYLVTSTNLGDDITIDVWTPNGYDPNGSIVYPVVYAHDGQNLFDGTFAFATVAWEIDQKAQELADQNLIYAPIVVGINNRGPKNLRANDYFPEKALNYIAEEDRANTYIYETCAAGFLGDEQAAFVVNELKPLIDVLYRTDTSRSHTFAMGSSLGGLASLYLMCEYPEVFGGAACLSTHWIGSLDLNADYSMNDDPVCANALLDYVRVNLPSSDTHRLYFDQGTKDWDAGYLKYEAVAREIANEKGYTTEAGNFETYDDVGGYHNEWFWQHRVDRPLKFLLDKNVLDAGCSSIEVDNAPDDTYINMSGQSFQTTNPETLPNGIYINNKKKILVR